jgi:hypothetical protein
MLSVLRKTGFDRSESARIRVNYSQDGPEWRLAQWDFRPHAARAAGAGVSQSPLTDEIADKFINAKPGSDHYRDYLKLWPKDATYVPGQIHVPERLFPASALQYDAGDPAMPTPVNLCRANPAVRDVLALQRCRGCHAKEAGAIFTQISNRPADKPSILAHFLIGNNPQPTLKELYYATQANVFYTKVRYDTYVGTAESPTRCDQKVTKCETRRYHDLARRALFLAALLAAPETLGPDSASKTALAQLAEFHTRFPD